MPYPANTAPLYDAIVNALTVSTGQPRAIPADLLFRLGRPDELRQGPSTEALIRQRRCYVMPVLSRPVDPRLQLTDRRRVAVTVVIYCWYYAGQELYRKEHEAAGKLADADTQRISAALTYPGALYLAPSGAETGLDGGSLRADDGRHAVEGPSVMTAPRQQKTSAVVLEVKHTFTAECELSIP